MLYLDSKKYEYLGLNDENLHQFQRIGKLEFILVEEACLKVNAQCIKFYSNEPHLKEYQRRLVEFNGSV